MWMTIQSNTTHNNVCTWRNGLLLEWENVTLSSAHNSEILDSKTNLKPVEFKIGLYWKKLFVLLVIALISSVIYFNEKDRCIFA